MEWCDATKGETFILGQNYPNPVTTSTSIPFTLDKPDFVSLKIYDLLGKEVAVLLQEDRIAGSHTATWDASGLPRDVYFAVLRTGAGTECRRMVLVSESGR